MRTTLTLEPDVERLVRGFMQERGLTFKDAVNEAIRSGLRRSSNVVRRETPAFALGMATIDMTQAVRLAAEMEDDEIVRKITVGR